MASISSACVEARDLVGNCKVRTQPQAVESGKEGQKSVEAGEGGAVPKTSSGHPSSQQVDALQHPCSWCRPLKLPTLTGILLNNVLQRKERESYSGVSSEGLGCSLCLHRTAAAHFTAAVACCSQEECKTPPPWGSCCAD